MRNKHLEAARLHARTAHLIRVTDDEDAIEAMAREAYAASHDADFDRTPQDLLDQTGDTDTAESAHEALALWHLCQAPEGDE
jgi:hypothetical protein